MSIKRPPRRFGYGEFEEPSGWRSKEYLQRQILAQARTQEQTLLDELADTLFPLYQALPAAIRPWTWQTWESIKGRAEAGDPVFSAFRDALLAWVQKWFKDTPHWLLLDTIETLQSWKWGGPGVAPDWNFGGDVDIVQYHSPTLEEEVPFQFDHPGWPFWRQQQADWITELDAAYAIARANYLQQWTAVANDLGLVRTAEVRQRSDWHIPAFVRFQVLGESKKDILFSLRPNVNSRRQIDKVFKEIEVDANIKLRREPQGRPKGTRDRGGVTRR